MKTNRRATIVAGPAAAPVNKIITRPTATRDDKLAHRAP
jgi:hypothetical protein